MTVTWQGVPVTGLLQKFHSEIQQTVNSSSLTCSHPIGSVAWYLAIGNTRLTTQSFGTYRYTVSNRHTTGVRTYQVLVDGNYQYTL